MEELLSYIEGTDEKIRAVQIFKALEGMKFYAAQELLEGCKNCLRRIEVHYK